MTEQPTIFKSGSQVVRRCAHNADIRQFRLLPRATILSSAQCSNGIIQSTPFRARTVKIIGKCGPHACGNVARHGENRLIEVLSVASATCRNDFTASRVLTSRCLSAWLAVPFLGGSDYVRHSDLSSGYVRAMIPKENNFRYGCRPLVQVTYRYDGSRTLFPCGSRGNLSVVRSALKAGIAERFDTPAALAISLRGIVPGLMSPDGFDSVLGSSPSSSTAEAAH